MQAVKWAGDVVDNEGMNKNSSKSELLSLDRSSLLRISVLRQLETLHASCPCLNWTPSLRLKQVLDPSICCSTQCNELCPPTRSQCMQNAVFSTSSDHLGSGVMMRARRHARTADVPKGSRAQKQPASKPVEACAWTTQHCIMHLQKLESPTSSSQSEGTSVALSQNVEVASTRSALVLSETCLCSYLALG